MATTLQEVMKEVVAPRAEVVMKGLVAAVWEMEASLAAVEALVAPVEAEVLKAGAQKGAAALVAAV